MATVWNNPEFSAYQAERDQLTEILQFEGISNPQVLEAIRHTPRHIFVDNSLSYCAYINRPLPIDCKQTISQPFIVAQMTELLLETGQPKKVLEIGTGCGYQTAILAQLVPQVYTIERIFSLHQQAQHNLARLGLGNIEFHYGDGSLGWPQHAPFDGIMVTAGVKQIPPALLEQLADNGVMVIPVASHSGQVLQKITRSKAAYHTQTLEHVSFVPFLSGVE